MMVQKSKARTSPANHYSGFKTNLLTTKPKTRLDLIFPTRKQIRCNMPLKEAFPSLFRCTSGPNSISTDIWQDFGWFIHLRTIRAVELSEKEKRTCMQSNAFLGQFTVVKGKSLTLNNLQKRDIPLCKDAHSVRMMLRMPIIFFFIVKLHVKSGIFSSMPWTKYGFILQPLGVFVRQDEDGMSKVSSKIQNTIPVVVWWVIREEHNTEVFEDRRDNILNLKN